VFARLVLALNAVGAEQFFQPFNRLRAVF